MPGIPGFRRGLPDAAQIARIAAVDACEACDFGLSALAAITQAPGTQWETLTAAHGGWAVVRQREAEVRNALLDVITADAEAREGVQRQAMQRDMLRPPFTPELVSEVADIAAEAKLGAAQAEEGDDSAAADVLRRVAGQHLTPEHAETVLTVARLFSEAEAPTRAAQQAARRWPLLAAIAAAAGPAAAEAQAAAAAAGRPCAIVAVIGGGGAGAAAAARAAPGARVFVLERRPALAAAARAVAAASGLGDRITVVDSPSRVDPADLVIVDDFDPDGLLGTGALAELRKLLHRLQSAGAPPRVVPERLTVAVAVADAAQREIMGFDVSPVASRAHLSPHLRELNPASPYDPRPSTIAGPEAVFDLSLAKEDSAPDDATVALKSTAGGTFNAAVFRMTLWDRGSELGQVDVLQCLSEARAAPGEAVQLRVRRNAGRIWADCSTLPPLVPPYGRGFQLGWFADMLRDALRNERYDTAIRKVVAEQVPTAGSKGVTVVDAGCGTGLLTLCAMRAGAAAAVGVEREPYLAMLASMCTGREANRAQFPIPRADFVVALDDALDACLADENRGNVLVAELMDASGVGEDIAGIVLHAHRAFLQSGAVVVPRKVVVMGAVASMRLPGMAPGCNMAPLEAFWLGQGSAEAGVELAPGGDGGEWSLLTEPAALLTLDLSDPSALGRALAPQRVQLTATPSGGTANAVVCWFDAELCKGVSLDNAPPLPGRPETPVTHWGQAAQRLPAPLLLRPGEVVEVEACCAGATLRVTRVSGGEQSEAPADAAEATAAAVALQRAARDRAEGLLRPLMRAAAADPRQLAAVQGAVLAVACHPVLFGVDAGASAALLRVAYLRSP
eukprot:TRINITY_DN22159_c0_g1_i1.p1 TRINITY_DN22159_c0_g1~~TRINITY_DN22159_c0_g1_i1.p1  ORF type:complete len:885 (+),score=263.16 TRINITY_DN22159_c0_g1_i1:112-2655(+)